VLLICLAGAATAAAQESLQTVKDLYASAAYEEALAVVSRLRREPAQPEIEQYRVFCLIALGRQDEAQKAIETLLTADPLYAPDPAETSPRVQERFKQTRQHLIPDLTKRMYSEGRAALDRKDRKEAVSRFERLLAFIDREGAAGSLAELRVLASGFLDLSRALPEPTPEPPAAQASTAAARPPVAAALPAAGSPVAGSPAAGSPAGAGSAAAEAPRSATVAETRPVALKQNIPSWVPADSVSRRMEFTGAVQVHIGADGRVESAEMIRRVHPSYDVALLRAARAWLYEPATRNGVPIASDLIVEVQLRPPQ
jgi:TonB family protein